MSSLTMDRSQGQHGAGPHDTPHIGDEHSDNEHVEDDVAPLREVRPKSSRGLLRKDTPAVLDTTSLRKGLLSADVHHSPLVTEEDEEEDEDDQPEPIHTKRQTAPIIRLESTWRSKSTKSSNTSVQNTDKKLNDTDNGLTNTGDVNSTTDMKDTVDTITSSTNKNNSNVGAANDIDGPNKQQNRSNKSQAVPKSKLIENATKGADYGSDHTDAPHGITVEYCDGTRPKIPPVQASNGGVKSCVKMIEARTELEKQMTASNKGKKPGVTFKERHAEGFHAQTKSGMKVLMRKETPASLPSVQKVKAAQRFRQTSESLVEESPKNEDEIDEDEDEIADALAGACGEG